MSTVRKDTAPKSNDPDRAVLTTAQTQNMKETTTKIPLKDPCHLASWFNEDEDIMEMGKANARSLLLTVRVLDSTLLLLFGARGMDLSVGQHDQRSLSLSWRRR